MATAPRAQGTWEPPFDHGGSPPALPQNTVHTLSPTRPPFFEVVTNPETEAGSKLNALHMSLIPVGPNQGSVLVWRDWIYCTGPAGETRALYWSIVDPVNQTFQNYLYASPEGEGDLFCAGHAWLPDGRLLVAGGTELHAERPQCPVTQEWSGAKLAYLFDPVRVYDPANADATTPWILQDNRMQHRRWYPSVLQLGTNPGVPTEDLVVVAGGLRDPGYNTYEVFVPPSGLQGPWLPGTNPDGTWPGPEFAVVNGPFSLGVYPRMHLLQNGLAVTAGFKPGSSLLDQYTASSTKWLPNIPTWQQFHDKAYGSSVLFPISMAGDAPQSIVVSTGGRDRGPMPPPSPLPPPLPPTNLVEMSNAVLPWPNSAWTGLPSMSLPRWFHNTVLLPDSTILVVGGEQTANQGCSEVPALTPELFTGDGWQSLAADSIVRDYHSAALLLPSGKVLTGGGEYRRYAAEGLGNCAAPVATEIQGPSDYRVFVPPSIAGASVRPVITSVAPPQGALLWPLNTMQTVTFDADSLPLGAEIAKVTLARAGSVTHHADPNQRVVSLKFSYKSGTTDTLQVTVPSSSNVLPRGHYMLFVVSTQGVPSEATWVQIQ